MGFTEKNYIDLTGLTTFKTAILSTEINDVNKTNTKTTATVKAIADYVDSEVSDLLDAVTTSLAGKVSSVSYDSTNKKLVYNKGDSDNIDIVSIATIKSDIGNFVKSGTGASSGLVPAPSTIEGTSKYLREDGTWAIPDSSVPYTHPTYTPKESGLYKITVDELGHVSGTTEVVKSDITGLGIPDSDSDTTYTIAPGDSNGQIKVTPSSGSEYNVDVTGLKSAAYCDTTSSVTSGNNSLVTSEGVYLALNGLDYRGVANSWSAVNTFTSSDTPSSGSSSAVGAIIASEGGIWAKQGIYGNKVYNAVWNDLADCIEVDEDCTPIPGYCYCFNGEKYYKSTKYMDDGIIGLHSDTYGIHMGSKPGCNLLDVAVAGFVLAYVDKEYPVGTPLTCTEDGRLTEIKKSDKIEYPEKIIATFWKVEKNKTWGSDGSQIEVNGRMWVKVK